MASDRLHILQVHGWWKVERPGGVITMMKTLATELEARGHTVSFLINDWGSPTLRRDEHEGRRLHTLRLAPPPAHPWQIKSLLAWLLRLYGTLRQLRDFARAHEIDVVHLHMVAPYQHYFRLLHQLGGPPYIVTLHRGEVVGYADQPSWHRRWMRVVAAGASYRVAVSKWLAERGAHTIFPGRTARVIYNGIDAADFTDIEEAPLPPAYSDRLQVRFFIMLANLHPYKGQDIAIRAWARVAAEAPDLHLALTGSGDIEAELRALANSLGVEDRVIFLGHVPRREALTLARHATGLLAPSRSEGFPYMVLEAGLLGIPVIASRIVPFTEYLADGETALFVPLEDHDALAAAALRLNVDAALRARLTTTMRATVQANFLAPVMAKQYEMAYRDALAVRNET